MDVQKIIDQLDGIYGSGKGFGVYTTIMPGILGDFEKLLKKSAKGSQVSEEYRLEDGKGSVYVTGKKLSNGQNEIDVRVIKF